MEFLSRPPAAGRIALLPGAWNPPTRAHLALAHASLAHADNVVFVLPGELPHKEIRRPSFEDRAAWIKALSEASPRFSAAVSGGGLFIEMAREARAAVDVSRLFIVCGSDAACRIAEWPYPAENPLSAQLREYELLVADRGDKYVPPADVASRLHTLEMDGDWSAVSSSKVRERIRRGEEWAHLVPDDLVEPLRAAYQS
jgi:nicotinic acid mononucleotide adenylyltransferase